MQNKSISTGNEFISIPEINEKDASIESVNFLHMGFRGLIEICGERDKGIPFLKPFLNVDGKERLLNNLCWERLNYWIPFCHKDFPDISIRCTVLAPLGERGFVYHMEVTNTSDKAIEISLGLNGLWHDTFHSINESKPMGGRKKVYHSDWNNSFICDMVNDVTDFSFAPYFTGDSFRSSFESDGNDVKFEVLSSVTLMPGESHSADFCWGICLEEVSAVTSAKQIMRNGFKNELKKTEKWLSEKTRSSGNVQLDTLFNTNLFFNYFYASGITMDTEEFVLVTSRSPRYYVSAAYWDRDSLLWSFPSILLTDNQYAKKMLKYVFGKQIKNIGMHSRFIDGVLLEPGFELDELCAPVIALYNYVRMSGDKDILSERFFSDGIEHILSMLETKKSLKTELYETFLLPSDDMALYPYVTYDNVLVWKVFSCLSELFTDIKSRQYCMELRKKAALVHESIMHNCVIEYEGKKLFAWSVDLNGKSDIYDEPSGSLELLPFYGFCSGDEEIYANTIEHLNRPDYEYSFCGCNIAYTGCAHAPHPWILSIANSLICGKRKKFLDILPLLKMDNGIACESVDETTGECATGNAFATCAGFLAYALYTAFYKDKENNC